jgi:glycosyltransferase
MPPHPTFYLRRSLVEKTGRFDLRYDISADYDYMLRALELHAASSIHITEPLVDFLVGGKSSGSVGKVLKGNLECLRSRHEHLGGPPIDLAFFLKPALKITQMTAISSKLE